MEYGLPALNLDLDMFWTIKTKFLEHFCVFLVLVFLTSFEVQNLDFLYRAMEIRSLFEICGLYFI